MREYTAFRACIFILAVMVLTPLSLYQLAHADDEPVANEQYEEKHEAEDQQDQRRPSSFGTYPKRQDNVFGTMDENMYMGKDRYTGDNILRVEPPPQPEQEQQQNQYPIKIAPEIIVKP